MTHAHELYITLDECLRIDGVLQPLPNVSALDAILKYHLLPLNQARKEIEHPIYIRSCYRSVAHELKNGRSGGSQHTFSDGKGAVDVSVTHDSKVLITPTLRSKMFELASALRKAGYKRIAFYPNKFFIHADHKGNAQLFFLSDDYSKWAQVTPENFYSKIVGDH